MKSYYLEKSLMGGKTPVFYSDKLDGGGKKWITQLSDYSFPKVNSVMEMCSGPGFVGYYLKHKYNIPKLILVDKYEPVKEFIDKTNKENGWESEVEFYLSDSFRNYDGPKVDMIVCNPPHLKSEKELRWVKINETHLDTTSFEEHGRRILLDENLHFHKNFISELNNFLLDDGLVVLLENKISIPIDMILSINPRLVIVDYFDVSNSLYTAILKLTSNS